MVPRHIRRFWLWVGVILLVEVAAITLAMRWHRIFPSHEVSELYTKYAGIEGIQASFVKDYRINDTVFVDVTCLMATTDSTWSVLQKDFAIPEVDSVLQQLIDKGYVKSMIGQVDKNDYSQIVLGDTCDAVLRAVSHQKKYIIIFHVKNVDEKNIVLHFHLKKHCQKNNEYEETFYKNRTHRSAECGRLLMR